VAHGERYDPTGLPAYALIRRDLAACELPDALSLAASDWEWSLASTRCISSAAALLAGLRIGHGSPKAPAILQSMD